VRPTHAVAHANAERQLDSGGNRWLRHLSECIGGTSALDKKAMALTAS
jgi:hypothetical protein